MKKEGYGHGLNRLKSEHFYAVFEFVTKGEDLTIKRCRDWEKAFGKNRTTITKLYRTANWLRDRSSALLSKVPKEQQGQWNPKPPSSSEADGAVEVIRYQATAQFVQAAFNHYLTWYIGRRAQESQCQPSANAESQTFHAFMVPNQTGVMDHARTTITFQSVQMTQVPYVIAEFRSILRSCLHNPHTEVVAELQDWKPLHFQGRDYRLEPVKWFRLCTPDLSNDLYWQPYFDQMKTYLKEIGFWDHYLRLQGASTELQNDYSAAALEVASKNTVFGKLWEEIRPNVGNSLIPSRIPADPAPDLERYAPCSSNTKTDTALGILAEKIPDLLERQCNVESLLQELNNDLMRTDFGLGDQKSTSYM